MGSYLLEEVHSSLIMSRIIAVLALIAAVAVAQTYAQGTVCNSCESDIITDVKDCQDNSTTDAVVKCVLEALKTSADCITCICDILADVFGMDRSRAENSDDFTNQF